MRHDRITEELRELAALYTLGSLTQHEARSYELHIKEGCSVCESELRKFRRAALEIGFSAEEISPPEYIRDLLSARIEREPQNLPVAPDPPQSAQDPNGISKKSSLNAIGPSFQSIEPRREKHVLSWILVVVLLVLGGLAAYEWRYAEERVKVLDARIASAKADLLNVRSQVDSGKQDFAKFGNILSSFGKPGSRIARLVVQTSSPEIPPDSSAAVVWDTEKSQCLVLGNFPPAPEGKIYQLWFFSPAAKVSAGALDINPTGPTFTRLTVPQQAANSTWAVVTMEPDNGSEIPTSPFYAKGPLQ